MDTRQKVAYLMAGELRALGKHAEADAKEAEADAMFQHTKGALGGTKAERIEEIKKRMEQEK
jgi:hypothetical protein